ncbi:MAG: hypothetical protein SFU56_20050 [Capsulimonadales bacterium]|nr:hypothetical protein [Capsulimonadales bacterium]
MSRLLFGLVLLVCLALAGCGDPPPENNPSPPPGAAAAGLKTAEPGGAPVKSEPATVPAAKPE